MSEARAKLYINTGVVTGRSDIYNILRPLLKQTVTYTYYRGTRVESSGTGWVERIVVDHPEIASYFTPAGDLPQPRLVRLPPVRHDQRPAAGLHARRSATSGSCSSSRPAAHSAWPAHGADVAAATGRRPLPRNADELARDLRFIQMELLMSADADAADGERSDEDEDGA